MRAALRRLIVRRRTTLAPCCCEPVQATVIRALWSRFFIGASKLRLVVQGEHQLLQIMVDDSSNERVVPHRSCYHLAKSTSRRPQEKAA